MSKISDKHNERHIQLLLLKKLNKLEEHQQKTPTKFNRKRWIRFKVFWTIFIKKWILRKKQ